MWSKDHEDHGRLSVVFQWSHSRQESPLWKARARRFRVIAKNVKLHAIHLDGQTRYGIITFHWRDAAQRGRLAAIQRVGNLLLAGRHIQGIAKQKVVERALADVDRIAEPFQSGDGVEIPAAAQRVYEW